MIGTIFNTAMIFCGSLLGTLFKKGMVSKYHDILMQGLGIAVVALGLIRRFSTCQTAGTPCFSF